MGPEQMFFTPYKLRHCHYPLTVFQSERSQEKHTKNTYFMYLGDFIPQPTHEMISEIEGY